MRLLAASVLFGMLSASAHAQAPVSLDNIDQSLFNDSEPVEETSEDHAPAPAPKAPPLPDTPEAEALEPNVIYDIAVLQGLKKVNAETSTFEVPLDTQVTFGTLTVTLKKCVRSSPDERPENAALIQIRDNRPGEEPTVVFSGWMFSSSPAISALEHPVYDITLLECTVHDVKKPEPKKTDDKKPDTKRKNDQR